MLWPTPRLMLQHHPHHGGGPPSGPERNQLWPNAFDVPRCFSGCPQQVHSFRTLLASRFPARVMSFQVPQLALLPLPCRSERNRSSPPPSCPFKYEPSCCLTLHYTHSSVSLHHYEPTGMPLSSNTFIMTHGQLFSVHLLS